MMFIDTKEGDVVIFEISGEILGSPEIIHFHGELHKYIEDGIRKFILDLKECTYMSGVGVSFLISMQKAIRDSDGSMIVCNIINEDIKNILTITGLDTIFEVKENREEATEEFKESVGQS